MVFSKDLRTNSNEVIERPSITSPIKAYQNSKRPKKAGYPKVYKNRPKKAVPNPTRKAPKNISKTFLKVKKEIAQTKVIDQKKILAQLEKLLKDFSRNSSFKDQRGEKD
jgi:hypothetical protein